MSRPSLFLFAGELSGDKLGSQLMRSLKDVAPDYTLSGVGGPSMRNEELQTLLKSEQFSVMGFGDVVMALPKLIKNFRIIKNYILNNTPKAVILIDYPEFNMRLAKSLKRNGYKGKIVQYISPSVWAWRPGRTNVLAKNLDRLLTIYPFEEAHYAHTSLSIKYIGNPVKERVNSYQYQDNWKEKINLPNSENLIGIFPGSRILELKHNLPLQLGAAKILQNQDPSRRFAISSAGDNLTELLVKEIKKAKLEIGKDVFIVPSNFSYELMRDSKTAIATSGTVTLELALHNCPSIVTYDISSFNSFLGKYILRINLPFYCIANIVAKKQVYPELIDSKIPAELVAEKAAAMDREGDLRRKSLDGCKDVINLLQTDNTSRKAAQAITELI